MKISALPFYTNIHSQKTPSTQNQVVSFGMAKDRFEKTSGSKQGGFKPVVFKEAKDVSSAKRYGKEVLGIKEYNGFQEKRDLEVINWINEGFTIVHNATKGKAIPPFKIDYFEFAPEEKDWYAAFEFTYPAGLITFNKTFIQNIDQIISNKISTACAKHAVSDKSGVFFIDSSSDSKSNFSKIPCLIKTAKNGYEFSSLFKKDKKAKVFEQELEKYIKNPLSYPLKDKIALNFTLKSILNSKYDFCRYEQSKTQKSPQLDFETISPFRCIAHETGHLQHFANDETYIKHMTKRDSNKKNVMWRKFKKDEKETASKISAYASFNPYEFVAETFAKMVCEQNATLDEDVIALYKRLDGPVFFR